MEKKKPEIVKVKCKYCQGRGYITYYLEGPKDCFLCKGKGYEIREIYKEGEGVAYD